MTQGSLTPKVDIYDIASNMTSTSLTSDRAYARIYADMHHPEPTSASRYGSADLLTGYYLGPTKAEALKETFKTFGLLDGVRAIQRIRAARKESGPWSKKVNRSGPSMTVIFSEGSDIPGNYPILFGIKDIEITVPVSSYIAKHEVRTSQRIDLSMITHLEVPEDAIRETEELLALHNIPIPVVAIEIGEAFSAMLALPHEKPSQQPPSRSWPQR